MSLGRRPAAKAVGARYANFWQRSDAPTTNGRHRPPADPLPDVLQQREMAETTCCPAPTKRWPKIEASSPWG